MQNFYRTFTFIIMCLGCFSVALANPNLKFAPIAMADDIPFKLNYSPTDYEFGKDIITLYNDLLKNEINPKILQKILANKAKAESFSHLDIVLGRLELVAKITNRDLFFNYCTIQPRKVNEFTESLSHRIDITIDRYCRYLFLNNLKKLSPSINLSTRDYNFLREAAPFYVTGENQGEMAAILKHFKENGMEHKKISDILIEKFIEYKIKPTTAILSNIQVNKELNLFIQNTTHLDNNSSSFFQEEFQKLLRDAQDLIEKEKYADAKTKINYALNFYSKNKAFISDKRAWILTIITAKAFYYKGRDKEAIETFELSVPLAPEEEYSEANFYLLWPHLVNKNYKEMLAVIKKYDFEDRYKTFNSKVKYWIAHALLENGQTKKATAYFNDVVSSSPFSFYSIISLKQLSLLEKGTTEADILAKLITKSEPTHYKMDVVSNHLKDSLKRMAIWNKIGNERFAILEQRHIQSLPKNDAFKDASFAKKVTNTEYKEFITVNLIKLLNDSSKFITSFKVYQDSLSDSSLTLNYKLIRYIFPLNYFDIIQKNSNDLDPLVVISLIRQESAFNPNATSRVGAKGLMQLMPATAKRFNKKIKVSTLDNPSVNISIGTRYLKQLFTRYDGNLVYTLASYNAGENRIDRWRKEIFRNDDAMATIEAIPFEETRNYVKLIYRNHFFYTLLNNRPAELSKPIDETFKVALKK